MPTVVCSYPAAGGQVRIASYQTFAVLELDMLELLLTSNSNRQSMKGPRMIVTILDLIVNSQDTAMACSPVFEGT